MYCPRTVRRDCRGPPGYPAMPCVTPWPRFSCPGRAPPKSWENTPSNTGATMEAEGRWGQDALLAAPVRRASSPRGQRGSQDGTDKHPARQMVEVGSWRLSDRLLWGWWQVVLPGVPWTTPAPAAPTWGPSARHCRAVPAAGTMRPSSGGIPAGTTPAVGSPRCTQHLRVGVKPSPRRAHSTRRATRSVATRR
jgi:hypothetical protein